MMNKQDIEAATTWFNEVMGLIRQCMLEKTKDSDLSNEDLSAIKTILAALQLSLDAVEPVDAWRPIETAPKDGTAVRVWDGSYQLDAWFDIDDGFSGDPNPLWLSGDGNDNSCGYYYTPCNPTHWQPLPTPPTLEKED